MYAKKVNRRIIVLLGKNMLWIDRPQKVNISVYLYASSKKMHSFSNGKYSNSNLYDLIL